MDSNIFTLDCGEGNAVKIHLYGATVISWICNGVEQLFLSSISKMDGSKAIRGGIPLVFPNFGQWSCGPQHGFARISWWKMDQIKKLEDGSSQATFTMEDNEQTRAMWNFKFHLCYTVTLKQGSLTTHLTVINKDTKSFDFTALLHTYFRVSHINECCVSGFKGCYYDDKVSKETGKTENREEISIAENVDRIYSGAGSMGHVIKSKDRQIKLEKKSLDDTVLWNPWSTKAKEMSDFDDEGYLNMVCVEPGHVTSRKCLEPEEKFECSQTMTLLS